MLYKARYWYAYNGIGNICLSSSYNLIPGNNKPTGCIGSAVICAIYAYSRFHTATPPGISTNICHYLTLAQAGTSNAYPLGSAVAFVYKITNLG